MEIESLDCMGFELTGCACGWEADLSLDVAGFTLDFIDKSEDKLLYKCDIVRNFFLATTESLLKSKWDENLKLCFDKSTPIIIKDGYNRITCKPIKALIPSSVKGNIYSGYKKQNVNVWTDNGWKKLEIVSRKKSTEKLLKIYTKTGCISLTESHELVINDRKVKAKDLNIGDTVNMYPYPNLSNKIKVDNDWSWLLGFFLAEGTCLSGKKKQKRIEFTNQNKNELIKCEKILNRLGVECKWYINNTRKDKCSFLRISKPGLLQSYFDEFYINREKTIPFFIYDFDRNSRMYFFKGLFAGDGGRHNTKAELYYNKYAHVINGLIWLSKDLCLSHSIQEQSNVYGSWFILNLKHRCKEHHSSKITKIESTTNDNLVYDIQCKGHIFCAGINNIRVHNCEHEDFFHRYKKAGYKVCWTNKVIAEKMTDRPQEYSNYRKQNFEEGLQYLIKKYKTTGWVNYVNLNRAKKTP